MKKLIPLIFLLFLLVGCPSPRVPPGPSREPFPETRAPEETPQTAAETYQKGVENFNNLNLSAAIRFFNLTIQQDPSHVKAYQGLGEIYTLQGKYELAEQNYVKALELDSTSVSILLNLGSIQARQGKYQEALDTYRRALEISPQNPVVLNRLSSLQTVVFDVHFQRGLELKQHGELDAALDEFQAAQRLSPQQVGPLVEIGYIFLEKKEYDEADKYFQEALVINAEFIPALLGAGEAQLVKGDPKKARSYIEKVLSIESENAQALALMEKLQEVQPPIAAPKPVPKEYEKIAAREAITRGELALLILFNLDLEEKANARPEFALPYRVRPISDITYHWAKPYIVKVTAYGFMEVFPDYTFQPDEVVTKGELASTINQVFKVFSKPLIIDPIRASSITFKDVPPENIYYRDVMAVYLAGIIDKTSVSEFGLDKPVSGSEAMETLARVKELL